MIWTDERKALARASVAKWLGTPHRPRMATPGVGVDCAALVFEIMIDSGICERMELGAYMHGSGLFTASYEQKQIFVESFFMSEYPPEEMEFGDIVIFREGWFSAHCAIVIDSHIVHAMSDRLVTKSNVAEWKKRFAAMLRFEEIGFREEPTAVIQRMKR